MSIKINISGDGLQYETETNLLKASQVIAFLGTEASSDSSQKAVLNPILDKPKTSPREALNDSGAKTNPQKIAVLGHYLMNRDKVETFSSAEVRETLKKSGEPLPANFSRDINEAVKLGYIYEDDNDKDRYWITESGNLKIREGFGENNETSKVKKNKKKRKSGGTNGDSKIREEVKNLEIETTFSGVSYWSSGLNKGQKILWLLAFADSKNIADLSPQEIEDLATRLKDSILVRDLSALTEANFKKGFIRKISSGNYKVLEPGIQFIKNYTPQENK